jgi:hypothetical protein
MSAALKTVEMKVGVHNPKIQEETKIGWRKKATETLRKNKSGLFSPEIQALGGKTGGKVTGHLRYEYPNHPELGIHNAGNLVQLQKRKGLPHGKENRRRIK